MVEDPIVNEIHKTRERLLERFGSSIESYLDHLVECEKDDAD